MSDGYRAAVKRIDELFVEVIDLRAEHAAAVAEAAALRIHLREVNAQIVYCLSQDGEERDDALRDLDLIQCSPIGPGAALLARLEAAEAGGAFAAEESRIYMDGRERMRAALVLALSVAEDCQQRWSRGHPERVETAKKVLADVDLREPGTIKTRLDTARAEVVSLSAEVVEQLGALTQCVSDADDARATIDMLTAEVERLKVEVGDALWLAKDRDNQLTSYEDEIVPALRADLDEALGLLRRYDEEGVSYAIDACLAKHERKGGGV